MYLDSRTISVSVSKLRTPCPSKDMKTHTRRCTDEAGNQQHIILLPEVRKIHQTSTRTLHVYYTVSCFQKQDYQNISARQTTVTTDILTFSAPCFPYIVPHCERLK